MANAIGQEVEERNHKTILEQKEVDEYREFNGSINFKYKGVTYYVDHKNLLEEEKDQIIKDIKCSHELLITEFYKLWKTFPIKNATVTILIAEDKNVDSIFYQTPWNTFTPLNKALINRNKSENKEENNQQGNSQKEGESYIQLHDNGKQAENESNKLNNEKEIESIIPQEIQRNSFIDVIIKPFTTALKFFTGFVSWLFGPNEEEHYDNTLKLDQLTEPNYLENDLSHDYQHSDLI